MLTVRSIFQKFRKVFNTLADEHGAHEWRKSDIVLIKINFGYQISFKTSSRQQCISLIEL